MESDTVSLNNMMRMKNEMVVLEFAKFDPNNSDVPIGIWFDRDHTPGHSPRIKIQAKREE